MSDLQESLQGVSAGKYLEVYEAFFSISTVKVQIWQTFVFYKADGLNEYKLSVTDR